MHRNCFADGKAIQFCSVVEEGMYKKNNDLHIWPLTNCIVCGGLTAQCPVVWWARLFQM